MSSIEYVLRTMLGAPTSIGAVAMALVAVVSRPVGESLRRAPGGVRVAALRWAAICVATTLVFVVPWLARGGVRTPPSSEVPDLEALAAVIVGANWALFVLSTWVAIDIERRERRKNA